MTPGQPAADEVADVARPGADDSERGRQSAPVIVLTYAQAGAARLQPLLSAQPALACTTGTGLLAACEQAAVAWRQADRRAGRLSALAASSVRSLAAGIMTIHTARLGGRRWCETAAAERGAAEVFLEVFPAARFVCLHRCCPDVVYAVLQASAWGLSGAGFAPYMAAHPGSSVAAVAAWWAGHAGPVLGFEDAHPGSCLRVRYEDLAADPGGVEREIAGFLGLDDAWPALPSLPGLPGDGGPVLAGAEAPGCGADLPVAQLPAPLLAQVNDLHARLGYPPLAAA